MIRSGFTIVEIVITVAIMGILLTLAVVGLNATQANARDAERKGDVEVLVHNLENFYANVNPAVPLSGGTYPGTLQLDESVYKTYLPDIDVRATLSPSASGDNDYTIVPATNTLMSPSGVLPQPSSEHDVYVYQPLQSNGSLCLDPGTGSDCRRFTVFYYQETTGTVEAMTSKHQ